MCTSTVRRSLLIRRRFVRAVATASHRRALEAGSHQSCRALPAAHSFARHASIEAAHLCFRRHEKVPYADAPLATLYYSLLITRYKYGFTNSYMT